MDECITPTFDFHFSARIRDVGLSRYKFLYVPENSQENETGPMTPFIAPGKPAID
jgi:hypothetical protein